MNYLTRVTHNNFAFNFTYDQLGRSKMIKVAGEELASFTYTDGQTSTVTTKSPNNNTSVITYDSHGNPTSQKINDKLIFEATYSTSGVLEKYVDELRKTCYTYTYNIDGNVTKITQTNTKSNSVIGYQSYTYDSGQRLTNHSDTRTTSVYKPIYDTHNYRICLDNSIIGWEYDKKYADI